MRLSTLLLVVGFLTLAVAPTPSHGIKDFRKKLDTFIQGKKYAGEKKTQWGPFGDGSAVAKNIYLPAQEAIATIDKDYKAIKATVTKKIGDIEKGADASAWRNPKSLDTVKKAADAFLGKKDAFVTAMQDVCKAQEGTFAAGANNMYAVKSESSIQSKVDRIKEGSKKTDAQALLEVNDGLRGTIVVPNAEKLKACVAALNKKFPSVIAWDNKFIKDKPSGYVGVHMLIKFEDIVSELQLHLISINDGTDECPKEYDHPIYEVTRTPKMDAGTVNQGNNAAKLGYLWGLSASETGGLETSAPSKKENDFTFQVLAKKPLDTSKSFFLELQGKRSKQRAFLYEYATGHLYRSRGQDIWRFEHANKQWKRLAGADMVTGFHETTHNGFTVSRTRAQQLMEADV